MSGNTAAMDYHYTAHTRIVTAACIPMHLHDTPRTLTLGGIGVCDGLTHLDPPLLLERRGRGIPHHVPQIETGGEHAELPWANTCGLMHNASGNEQCTGATRAVVLSWM